MFTVSSKSLLVILLTISLNQVHAGEGQETNEQLVKVASPLSTEAISKSLQNFGIKATPIFGSWIKVTAPARSESQTGMLASATLRNFLNSPSVIYRQPNFKLDRIKNPNWSRFVKTQFETNDNSRSSRDNPDILPAPTEVVSGPDQFRRSQWGMTDNAVESAWEISIGSPMIVAVIDTGVDYTHEDLIGQMWRNTNEIPNNNIDDDQNGYVDDIVGWDTLSDDNKPYDLAATSLSDILNGQNPGHGTHCAGTIGAAVNNNKGIISASPKAQIMALRFIGDEGGTTEGAVRAIRYAVDNGAKVLSNSWGSAGEDPENPNANQILIEAIQYSEEKGTLFVAAAGNSSRDNDTDALKSIPASYEMENIISVAAIDADNKIAGFSNYGAVSVDIGAPGVKIMSTVPGNRYQDTISEILMAHWDGTSMAAPYVSAAAALYWSAHPEKTVHEVKSAILSTAVPLASLTGKTVTGGKLSILNLMKK